jgi:excisionase family DNA binding protein
MNIDSPCSPLLTAALAASVSESKLPLVLDAEQCAALLRCSKQHVEALADAGELPATKIGRGWIFVTAQLLVSLAGRCSRRSALSEQQGMAAADPSREEPPALEPMPTVVPSPRRRGRPRSPLAELAAARSSPRSRR